VTAAELVAVLAGLLAVAVAATFPLILHLTTHLPNDLGDPVLNAWILWWDATAIRHGGAHIWDAPSYFPYLRTLAYSDHLFGLAIFTAPLQWLTGNPVLVYNVAFIGSYANAGVGMYLLARLLTDRRDAAGIAALAYAFTAFRIAHFAHVQWLMNGWLPLSLWALHRYFSSGAWKYLLASGACYVLQCLTANYFAYFGLLPLIAVAATEIWRRRPPLLRTAVHAIAVAALAALVLAPIARVYYQVREENNFRRTATEIESLSADLSDYATAHNQIWLWRYARKGTGEHELFPGAVALFLAGVTLSTRRGRATPYAGVYAMIAVTALVLSLGAHPSAWGHRSTLPGPYQLLLNTVPGLDGLRAVSRLGLIVVLALSVLAAQGAVLLFEWIGPRRRSMVVGLGLVVIAESWAVPVRTARFDPMPDPGDRDAYEFLRTSAAGAVLELPIDSTDEARQMRYQYLTLVHGHRTLNGRSSYDPPLLRLLAGHDQSPFARQDRLDAAVALARAVGVRYMVVHRGHFDDPAIEAALMRELERDAGQVVARRDFDETAVFTLAPDEGGQADDPETLQPIPAATMKVRASVSPDRLPLLFDANRDSRWLSAGRQNGKEWIEIAFDAPRDVARVRMQTAERSFGDYPRELLIEAVEPAGTRVLFSGSVLPAFGRGFLNDHAYPTIDIELPANQARAIRLRQLGITEQLFWSIHELQLLQRTGRASASPGTTHDPD
jgi:hypothetical protein